MLEGNKGHGTVVSTPEVFTLIIHFLYNTLPVCSPPDISCRSTQRKSTSALKSLFMLPFSYFPPLVTSYDNRKICLSHLIVCHLVKNLELFKCQI